MDTLKIIKCIDCNDPLTWGEEKFFYDYRQRHHEPPLCFQCGKKRMEKKVKEFNNRKSVEERMDEVQDQGFKWGEPRRSF